MKTKLTLLMLSAIAPMAIFLTVISGCTDDTTTNTPVYVNNPNVKTFDSIGVDEESAAFQSYTGINLLTGSTTLDSASSRDCSLQDRTNEGFDFYLQNGVFLNNLIAGGYEIRFFRVASDMSVNTFDTLSRLWTTAPDTQREVLLMSPVNAIDYSALEALRALHEMLLERGIRLDLTEVKGPVLDRLRAGAWDKWFRGRVFLSHHQGMQDVEGHGP